jgi:replicative DNA helicase
MEISQERIILSSLVRNDEFVRETLPFLKDEYFKDDIERALFNSIKGYLDKYNNAPNLTTLTVEIRETPSLNEEQTLEAEDIVKELFLIEPPGDKSWLIAQTESFCQNKAVYNAIMKAISIYDGSEKVLSPHAIPDFLRDAVGISFDTHVGMDFWDDAAKRYDFYTEPENKFPFGLKILNEITNGGILKKTLNLIVAGINVGKTLSLIDLACWYSRCGLNVLYITLEMREEMILQRVDANMLEISLNKIETLGRDNYLTRMGEIHQKGYGKIKVKELPTGTGTTSRFRHLINELKMKQKFKPDIIIVDYIGIMDSSRLKVGSTNSYFYLKSIAEELRGLAVETDTAIWTAMQLTRAGVQNSDAGITDIGESFGIPATADFILSVARTEELDQVGQLLMKQIKNRYGNKIKHIRFLVGVDLERQFLFDVTQREQDELIQEPVDDDVKFKMQSLKEKFAALNKFE